MFTDVFHCKWLTNIFIDEYFLQTQYSDEYLGV